jgi:enoyl-CoA hydratase
MDWQTVLYEKRGSIARITLNRPEKRNAQNYRMIAELDEAMKAAEKDDEIRVVVLAASGPAFSSGHDMSGMAPEGGMAEWGVGSEGHRDFEQEMFVDKCLYIRNLPKPTIAQVHGYCLAAGLMLASMWSNSWLSPGKWGSGRPKSSSSPATSLTPVRRTGWEW